MRSFTRHIGCDSKMAAKKTWTTLFDFSFKKTSVEQPVTVTAIPPEVDSLAASVGAFAERLDTDLESVQSESVAIDQCDASDGDADGVNDHLASDGDDTSPSDSDQSEDENALQNK